MKWKNYQEGAGCFYITATLTEWLPLLLDKTIRYTICREIAIALNQFQASLHAYVIMPDHIHLLVYLPLKDSLHEFCKAWRGRSGRRIAKLLASTADPALLAVLGRHANGACRYAVWKEQVRSLPVFTEGKCRTFMDYIHENPVRKGLVLDPRDWEFSSYVFYECQREGVLKVTPIEL